MIFKAIARTMNALLRPRTSVADPSGHARDAMVKHLMTSGITDERVLEAMRRVPRHRFVPNALQAQAYADGPLPIGYEQTISQPLVVASMTQALALSGHDNVLEIGAGCGYQSAVLAQLARRVYSVELIGALAAQSAARLKELGYANVFVRHADGYQGWPEKAPFDAIIVTAAPEQIPQSLVDQLKEGGRMVIPVGTKGNQVLWRLVKTDRGLQRQEMYPVRFVPMVGRG